MTETKLSRKEKASLVGRFVRGVWGYFVLGLLFAMLGIFAGYNFCRNILWSSGNIGDLWSSGTIALMNYAVGFKVLTGVGFLLLLVIYLLGMDEEHEFDGTIPTTEQEEGGMSK